MWIEVGCLNAALTRATEEERAWVREFLSFPDPSARFTGHDKFQMLNPITDEFPAGFVPIVKKAATKPAPEGPGFTVEILDLRTPPATRDPEADLGWLRDYQLEGVEKALLRTRGIEWLSTGAGKTEIAIGLVKAMPIRWLFLVHRGTLGEQTARRFEKRWLSGGLKPAEETAFRLGGRELSGLLGEIREGMWTEGSRLTIATFQTLARALEDLPTHPRHVKARELLAKTQGLIIDECHVLPADSFWRVAQAAENAYYRIGLSGTPLDRGDKRSALALAALGPVIHRVDSDQLVSAGVLARPRIRMLTVHHPKARGITWNEVENEQIVRGATRNAVLVGAMKQAAKPGLLFVKKVEHGRILSKLLWAAGVKNEFVWGDHSVEARKKKVEWLVREGEAVLICSVVFQEGVDIPELRSVGIGSGGKSVIAALQRIGRGMRSDEGKTEFEVYDVLDRGPPREEGEAPPWVERHANQRKHAYVSENFQTIVLPPGIYR